MVAELGEEHVTSAELGACAGTRGGAPTGDEPMDLTVDPEGWPRLRDRLAGAIVASATAERDDRLFPGDIAQFHSGGLNLAHGAAGVLHALALQTSAPEGA